MDSTLIGAVAKSLCTSMWPLGLNCSCEAIRTEFGVVLQIRIAFKVTFGPSSETQQLSIDYGFSGRETEDWAKWWTKHTLDQIFRAMTEASRKYMEARSEIVLPSTLEWKS